jgi:multicomponent Na+:H+ antiporter subunit E
MAFAWFSGRELPQYRAIADGRGGKMRIVGLAAVLFVFWLALSGHYTGFLVTIGAASAVLCAYLAIKLRLVDQTFAFHLLPRALLYWPWLVWEILKSAWSVSWTILNPRLPISPTMLRVKAGQKTQVGIATYANSITLTPGTLTVGVDGNDLLIHALNASGADDLETGRMDAQVSWFEGEN